jgi:hypothetical protein
VLENTTTSSLEHEARSSGPGPVETIMHDIQDYHISPEEAAAIAEDGSLYTLPLNSTEIRVGRIDE